MSDTVIWLSKTSTTGTVTFSYIVNKYGGTLQTMRHDSLPVHDKKRWWHLKQRSLDGILSWRMTLGWITSIKHWFNVMFSKVQPQSFCYWAETPSWRKQDVSALKCSRLKTLKYLPATLNVLLLSWYQNISLLTPKETSRCLFSSNKSVCQERSSVLKQRRPEANRKCFTASVQPIKRNQTDVYYTASSLFIAQLAAASGYYLHFGFGFIKTGRLWSEQKKKKISCWNLSCLYLIC